MSTVIGLIGAAGSGKSSVALRLVERFRFSEYSFAEPLKQLCAEQFGWDYDKLNDLGYKVLRGGVVDVDLAILIFRVNTVAYPDSFNTWDSLGEAYLETGDHEKAIVNYKKSLELNPDNANAVEMLKRIQVQAE